MDDAPAIRPRRGMRARDAQLRRRMCSAPWGLERIFMQMAVMDPVEFQRAVRRYAALTASAMPPAESFSAESEAPDRVQVERGMVYPLCLRGAVKVEAWTPADRLVELARRTDLSGVVVVDRLGHHRPVYRPLLVYAWLSAYRLAYEALPRAQFGQWEEGLRVWCDLLETDLSGAPLPTAGGGAISAASGAEVGEAAWGALALSAAGRLFHRDAWTDLASDAFGRLVAAQQPSGAWLASSPADQPETHWFHELVLLHAAASFAVRTEDRRVASAVARSARHHLAEIQPDHATHQPWALFAFVWEPTARPLADALLHAAPSSAGLTSILLADALYCLELF